MKNKIFLSIISLFVGGALFSGVIAWAAPGFFLQGGNSFLEIATLGTTDNFDLRVITNNAEKLRILTGGNVGIGTTSPSSKLHVVGTGNITGNTTVGGTLSVTGASTLFGGLTLTCAGCITDANLANTLTGKTYNGLTVSTTTGILTLSNGSTLATSGPNSITLTSTGATNITLPTSGTLVNTGVTALSSLASIGTITTGVWNGSTIGVANGGTGATTFTDGGVLIGNGTSTVQATSAGTAGQVLTSNGAGNDPTFQAPDGFSLLASGSFSSTTSATFTVDPATDIFTSNAHGLINGDKVKVSSTGTLPSPLGTNGGYFVIEKTTNTFKLAQDIPYGISVAITDAGTGTHTWTNALGSMNISFTPKNNLHIVAQITAPSASADLRAMVNTDGGNNYGLSQLTAGSALSTQSTQPYWRELGGAGSTNERFMILDLVNWAAYRKHGQFSGQVEGNQGTVAGVPVFGSVIWNNTSEQISNLLFFCNGAIAFGTGSKIWIYGAD